MTVRKVILAYLIFGVFAVMFLWWLTQYLWALWPYIGYFVVAVGAVAVLCWATTVLMIHHNPDSR